MLDCAIVLREVLHATITGLLVQLPGICYGVQHRERGGWREGGRDR